MISFFLVVMIAFLLIAFITKDVVISQLFVALALIIGVLVSKHLSPKNPKYNQQNNKNEKLILIEGDFSFDEAKEILISTGCL